MELQPTRFNLITLLESTVKLLKVKYKYKGVELIPNLDHGLSVMVFADENRLRQIILNLLSNAMKYTMEGDVKFNIYPIDGGLIRFEVVDTGVGISNDEQQDIFEPFIQAGDNNATDGTGLGLAICRKLVNMMGADLKLESEVGVGSKFWFELNLMKVEEKNVSLPHSEVFTLEPDGIPPIHSIKDSYFYPLPELSDNIKENIVRAANLGDPEGLKLALDLVRNLRVSTTEHGDFINHINELVDEFEFNRIIDIMQNHS